MKIETYTVAENKFRVNSGEIRLNKKQALPRMHNLRALRQPGMYEVVKPVEFKSGEVIGLPADSLSKASRASLMTDQEQAAAPKTIETPRRTTVSGATVDDGDIDLITKAGDAE